MELRIILFFLSICVCFSAASIKKKLVCHFSYLNTDTMKFFPEDINPNLCTHLIYYFAKLSGNNIIPWNKIQQSMIIYILP